MDEQVVDEQAVHEVLVSALSRGRVTFDGSGECSGLPTDLVREVLLPLTVGAVARASLGRRSAVAVCPGPGGTWLCSVHGDLTDAATLRAELFATAEEASACADRVLQVAVAAGDVSARAYEVETRWRAHAVAEALAGGPGPPFPFA